MPLAGRLRLPSLFTCATLWLHEVGLGASLDPLYRQDNHLREMKGPFQGRTAGEGQARLQTWVGQAWKPVGTHRVVLPSRPTFSFLEGGRASWPACLEGGGQQGEGMVVMEVGGSRTASRSSDRKGLRSVPSEDTSDQKVPRGWHGLPVFSRMLWLPRVGGL